MRKKLFQIIWPVLSLVLLSGAYVETQLYHIPPAETEAYHERVAEAIDDLPYSVNDWIGRDIPVPPAAFALLRANSIFSRSYTNLNTGQSTSVILVHCQDSRDITGHYPPNCYPSQGWVQTDATRINLPMNGQPFEATQYDFLRSNLTGDIRMTVINFMVLPNGELAPDLRAVNQMSQVNQLKFYGVGQVQIIVPSSLPQEEKEAIAIRFIEMLSPAFAAIWSGIDPS